MRQQAKRVSAEVESTNDIGCFFAVVGAVGGCVAGFLSGYFGFGRLFRPPGRYDESYDELEWAIWGVGCGLAYAVLGVVAVVLFRRMVKRHRAEN